MPKVKPNPVAPGRYDSTAILYIPHPAVNLCSPQQASMEDGTLVWQNLLNATASNYSGESVDGYHGVACTSVAAGNASINSNYIPGVSQGCLYAAQATFRAATVARQCTVQINFYAGVSYLGGPASSPVFDATDGWITAGVQGVAPATTTQAQVVLNFTATGAANEVHYADHIAFGLI